jgi:hypothetical protein
METSSMAARGAPRLEPGLIARKGEAAPAPAVQPASDPADEAPPAPASAKGEAPSIHEVVRMGAENMQRTHLARQQRANPAEVAVVTARPVAPVAASRGAPDSVAVTVRLDQPRYERLKLHGARRRRTNQAIILEALDRYLDANAD